MPEIRRCPICKASVVVTSQGACPLGHSLDTAGALTLDSQASEVPQYAEENNLHDPAMTDGLE